MKTKTGELTKYIADIVAARWIRKIEDMKHEGFKDGGATRKSLRRKQ